jgi:hypothetical protein
MHGREGLPVNLASRIEQLTRGVGVVDGLALSRGAGPAETAGNRVTGVGGITVGLDRAE